MINAAAFKECMLCAYAALQKNVQTINDLNVFPVPDGDTGTNMGLTMERAATELRRQDFDTIAAASDCVASALLRAARGNSGGCFAGSPRSSRACTRPTPRPSPPPCRRASRPPTKPS